MDEATRRTSERWVWALMLVGAGWVGASTLANRLVSPASQPERTPSPNTIVSVGVAVAILAFVSGIAVARRRSTQGRAWILGVAGAAAQAAAVAWGSIWNHKDLLSVTTGTLAVGILGIAFLSGTLYWYGSQGGRDYFRKLAVEPSTPARVRTARRFLLAVWYASLFGAWFRGEAPWQRGHDGLGGWLRAGLSALVFSTAVMIATLVAIGGVIMLRRRFARR